MTTLATRLLAPACLLAVLSAGCSDPQAAKEKYLASGNTAFETEQYGEAILAYRNVLEIDPLHAGARQKLAAAYERTGDLKNAGREYVRAADLLPQDATAQLNAARSLLASGFFEDAATRARQAIEIDGRNAEAHIILGAAVAGGKDFEGAVQQLQEAIEIDPASSNTHVNMGALLMTQRRNREAEASFERAVANAPKSVAARLALATFHLNTGSLDKAESAVKEALALSPSNAQANRAMALLLMATGRTAEAEPFVKAVVSTSAAPEAELALADYYLRVNRVEAAVPILERLASSEKLYAQANLRLAGIDYTAGRTTAAHKRLDDVLKKFPDLPEALIARAHWQLMEGHATDALRSAEHAVRTDRSSARGQFILGRARYATGDPVGAEEAFSEVLRLNPAAGVAQTELARLNIASGRTDTGVQFAREAVKTQPQNLEARVLLVRGLIASRDLTRASAELEPLVRALPQNPTVGALRGSLLALKDDTAGARREYERALALDPAQLDALAGLTSMDVRAGQLERARKRLAAQIDRTPGNAAVLLLAARTDVQAQDFELAERRLRRVIELAPSTIGAYGVLAAVYVRQRNLDGARAEFERIAQRNPRDVGALTLIGIILETQNRHEEAERAYRRVLEVDPSAPVAANNLAYMYADSDRNLDEALALARAAASRLPDHPPVTDTVGWVYYKKDRLDLAVQQFTASLSKDPANPTYHYHLGLAYSRMGERDKARTALREALRLNAAFPGADQARRILATLES